MAYPWTTPVDKGVRTVDANQQHDVTLIERIRSREPGARDELVAKYIPLVRHIVRRYYVHGMDFDDLVQEGLIGLLGAIDEYRPDLFPVRFSSFAYLCVARKIYNVIKRVRAAKHRVNVEALSLYARLGSDDDRTLLEVQADVAAATDPQEIVVDRLAARDLNRLLASRLSLLEYTVLALLLQGFSCSDIGAKLGVDAKAVDNARTRVRLKLRRLLECHGSLLDARPRRSPARRSAAARKPQLLLHI